MHIQTGDTELLMRAAEPGDDDFILGLVPRFVDFDLPKGRKRVEVTEGIRRDLRKHLDDDMPGSFLYVAETDDGKRAGFLHLQIVSDFFSGRSNCHISDLVLTRDWDGRGLGRAMLDFAERFAREHGCERLTLSVFPGNERARKLYADVGFETDILKLAKPL
ncbi:MAG TPA: GNAT family N-acetyltransferase [Xanthomonadales bacterium]|nr:GNAT family N-acetyltransferase [Xanthomonadales bacterium]